EELTQKLSHYEDGQQLLHNLMQSHPPPAPPAQVAELQQEVLKWKNMFQRACVAARTAELRAEEAE
ncbi:hypothetical protein PENTCL1PPCAC_24232, partial [Pristionchus entomophagus]